MGRMEIEVDGASVASVQQGMDVLEKLGIEKARATARWIVRNYISQKYFIISVV